QDSLSGRRTDEDEARHNEGSRNRRRRLELSEDLVKRDDSRTEFMMFTFRFREFFTGLSSSRIAKDFGLLWSGNAVWVPCQAARSLRQTKTTWEIGGNSRPWGDACGRSGRGRPTDSSRCETNSGQAQSRRVELRIR